MRSRFAPDFRRFLPAWLVFGSSVSLAAFVLLAPQSVLGMIDRDAGEDAPPMLVLSLCVLIYFGALAVGLLVVPFRRLVIGPSLPFVRRGYLVVAALPLVCLVVPGLLSVQRIYLTAASEIFLAAGALIFVALGRVFGAFDDEEIAVGRGGPRSRPSSKVRRG